MALADNRTFLNDCEDDGQTFTTSGGQLGTENSAAGLIFQGSASIEVQHSDNNDRTTTTGDSAGSSFNIDLSDSTLYLIVKDNLVDTFDASAGGNGGMQMVIGDGTDLIGYPVGGSDARGLPLAKQFNTIKLDVSEIVASPPGNVATYSGSEANLDQTNIDEVGYGSLHSSKAAGAIPNVWLDGVYYIANDSYAATITGGTSGTPETMADVVGDDVTAGAGMFNNPKALEYGIFVPTEWGDSGASDSYFSAAGEQWYFYGDNGGGHALGASHFPQRVIGGTGTNSWVLDGVTLVNIGTPAEFDMSDANVDILTVAGGLWNGFGTISLPSSGGTSRFTTDVVFSECAQITNNGADMDGCSILDSTVATNTGALLFNEASDPDGTLGNLTIEKGPNAHHAIDFGTNVDSSLTSITLRGIDFTGFGATDDANDSTVRFLATTGSLTLNLIDCTVDGVSPVASGGGKNFSVDDSAGMTVTVVVQPVTLQITVKDKNTLAEIENVQTSIHLRESPFTELMNEDTNASGIASESYSGVTPVDVVWKCRKSEDTDNPRYKGDSSIETITSNGLEITVLLEENPVLN